MDPDTKIMLILVIGGLCLLVLCGIAVDRSQKRAVKNPTIVIVDGCEYIQLKGYYGYPTLTHKGNCKNH